MTTAQPSLFSSFKDLILSHWGWVVGCVIAFFSIRMQFTVLVNQDLAWHLHIAEGLLNGKTLYVDFMDPNPPLVFYWAMIPVLLAEYIKLDIFSTSHVVDFFAALWCIATAHFALRFTSIGRERFFGQFFLLTLFIVIFLLPLCSWANSFFNKDVMVLPFILPYILLALGRIEKEIRPDIISVTIVGLMAGFGFCIKPHFLLIFIFIELYAWLATRKDNTVKHSFGFDSILILLWVTAYGGFITLMHPDYFTHALPLVTFTHPLFTNQSSVVFDFILTLTLPTIAILITALLCGRRHSSWLFLGITLCFFLITFAQNKGWAYQVYPVVAAGYLLFSALISEFFKNSTDKLKTFSILSYMRLACLIGCAFFVYEKGVKSYQEQFHTLFFTPHLEQLYSIEAITRYTEIAAKKRPNILVLSEALHHTYPAISYSKANTSFPLPFLFPVTAVENFRTLHRDDMDKETLEQHIRPTLHYLFNTVNGYLSEEKPDIIIARNRGNFHIRWEKKDINLIDYLKEDHTFARLMADYYQLPTSQAQPYDVYYREGALKKGIDSNDLSMTKPLSVQ